MNAREKEINGVKLEICSNSSYSALQAQLGGATRVEFCQNLENGGITPSYGQITRARQLLHIGMHVLIRPRGGDFVYTDDEFEEMKMDIGFCKEIGCDGVVFGILSADGSVDRVRNATLVALAKPMTVVFHRAFDRTKNPSEALEEVIELGFDRILTSGLRNTAEEGKDVLKDLVLQAEGRIEIMPGAGVNAKNMLEIIQKTGAKSIHSSAKISVSSQMTYVSEALDGMNEPTLQTSRELVEELKGLLEAL